MNIQDLLTYLLDAIAFGYVAVLMFDLGERISGELFDIFSPASTVQLSALGAESPELVPPLALFTPVVEDPWAAVHNLEIP